MKSKKQIRLDQRKKPKTKNKDKLMIFLGISLIIYGVIQSIVIGYLYFNQEHNQIIYNDKVVTTEVCSNWIYNLSDKYKEHLDYYYFRDGKIPKEVIVEVCPKWQEIKEFYEEKGVEQNE